MSIGFLPAMIVVKQPQSCESKDQGALTLLVERDARLRSAADPPRCSSASSHTGKRLAETSVLRSYAARPPMMIDAYSSYLTIGSDVIKLSDDEAEILERIARAPQQIMSFQSLAQVLYLQDIGHDEAREMVKGRVYRIRQKIEENPDEPTIL